MKTKIRYGILVMILIALAIPAIYRLKPFLNLAPLTGVNSVANKPEWSSEAYWEGRYQDDVNKWINEQFGFRTVLVRLINQFRYSVFSTSRAPGVVVGKNRELYISSYLEEYIGKNYRGFSMLNDITLRTKRVQDSLKAIGVDLVVVFAPGKASFKAENIPTYYLNAKKDSTNYKTYCQLFKQHNINFIDLNSYFLKLKPKPPHPLFPKFGAHWNHHAMCIGLDTILKRIEQVHHIDVPDFDYSQIRLTNASKGNDYDIGILMNLKKELPKEIMPYPVYKINETNKEKPDVLVVGDSYWWCLVGENLPSRFFKRDEYWFYNKDIILNGEKKENKVRFVNLFQQVCQRKTIVLLSTEATYYLFPYNFIERLEKLFCIDNKQVWDLANTRIRPDSVWYASIIQKAKEGGISTEKQLYRDAKYTLLDELSNTGEPRAEVMANIKVDANWLKQIEEKAKQEKRSFEEQLILDADFMVKEERKLIYEGLTPKPKSDETKAPKEDIASIINRIRADEKWLNYVKEKAVKEKRSLEAQLSVEAEYTQKNP